MRPVVLLVVGLSGCGFDLDLGVRIANDAGRDGAAVDAMADAPPIYIDAPIDGPPIDMPPPAACLSDPAFTTRASTGHRYQLVTTPLSWTEAREACTATGAHLVVIEDGPENAYVDALSVNIFWIGLSDSAQEGSFVWVNGDPLVAGSFTSWRASQPNDEGDQDCTEMDPNSAGTWNDFTCGTPQRYVCECEP